MLDDGGDIGGAVFGGSCCYSLVGAGMALSVTPPRGIDPELERWLAEQFLEVARLLEGGGGFRTELVGSVNVDFEMGPLAVHDTGIVLPADAEWLLVNIGRPTAADRTEEVTWRWFSNIKLRSLSPLEEGGASRRALDYAVELSIPSRLGAFDVYFHRNAAYHLMAATLTAGSVDLMPLIVYKVL